MDQIQLHITFVAILSGLGLTDLIRSLHLLLRHRRKVKWHWIPMIYAFASFQTMIIVWFNIEKELNSPLTYTSLGFFVWLFPTILLLLIMLAVLPDDTPESDFDLLNWFMGQRKYFFSLLLLFIVALVVRRILMDETAEGWYVPLVPAALFILLMFTKNYTLHAIGAVFVFLFFSLQFYLQLAGFV